MRVGMRVGVRVCRNEIGSIFMHMHARMIMGWVADQESCEVVVHQTVVQIDVLLFIVFIEKIDFRDCAQGRSTSCSGIAFCPRLYKRDTSAAQS